MIFYIHAPSWGNEDILEIILALLRWKGGVSWKKKFIYKILFTQTKVVAFLGCNTTRMCISFSSRKRLMCHVYNRISFIDILLLLFHTR